MTLISARCYCTYSRDSGNCWRQGRRVTWGLGELTVCALPSGGDQRVCYSTLVHIPYCVSKLPDDTVLARRLGQERAIRNDERWAGDTRGPEVDKGTRDLAQKLQIMTALSCSKNSTNDSNGVPWTKVRLYLETCRST